MLALAAIAGLQAATPNVAAQAAPTFCERMAKVWPMTTYRNTRGLVYRVQLKGGGGRTYGYEPGDELSRWLSPMPEAFCGRSRTGRAAVCHVAGPGVYRISSKRADRAFEALPGEHATVETDGRSVACQDRTAAADYTRFEPLD